MITYIVIIFKRVIILNIDDYLDECRRMKQLKIKNKDIEKVYSDINFDKLIERVIVDQERHKAIAFAELLFRNGE